MTLARYCPAYVSPGKHGSGLENGLNVSPGKHS